MVDMHQLMNYYWVFRADLMQYFFGYKSGQYHPMENTKIFHTFNRTIVEK